MTSNRRTQPPICLDRSYVNGENLNCSPSKITSPSPSASNWAFRLRRVLSGVIHQKSSKKGNSAWKRYLMTCSIFFILGLFLGLIPAANIEDTRNYDAPFKIRSPPFHSQKDFVDGHQQENYAIENLKTERIVSIKSDERENQLQVVPRKLLIIVTPTYNRPIQAYYLHRLSQELRLVPPPLLWIVVEMNAVSLETASILSKTGVMYRHLVCFKNSTNIKDRGVHQRNTALEHIGRHKLDGIVYFADDDNTYSLELFEHLREIRRFGTWPVGMLAQSKNKATLEGPVCNGSQVIGWHTNEKSKRLRRFHVDMSGFAFNSTILWDAKRWNRPTSYSVRQLDTVKEGFQETTFIEQIVENESQMEGLPHGCSKIMNWHLHLEAHFYYPKEWRLQKYLDAVVPFE